MLVKAPLILVARVFMPATAANAINATTNAYSIRLDLPPNLRQPVKGHNSSNGELSHGIVS
jgi:hypothetical protein